MEDLKKLLNDPHSMSVLMGMLEDAKIELDAEKANKSKKRESGIPPDSPS